MQASRRSLRKSLRTNFDAGPRGWLREAKLKLRQARNLPGAVRGGRPEAPVFIIGAPRSGTSMLFQILSASPNLANWPPPGEAHQLWEMEYHPALTGWRSNVLTATHVTPEVAKRVNRDALLMVGNRRPMLEKAPRNSLRVPFLEALFPDARYIHLQRDGRDNVNSLINAWRTPRYRTYEMPEPLEVPGCDPRWWKFVLYPGWEEDRKGPVEVIAARQWMVSNDLALDALEAVPEDRKTVVRYEDFVLDPATGVQSLERFLQVPSSPLVRERAERSRSAPVNTVTPPEQGKWKRENPEEIESILPLIGPTLERLGYPAP